MYTEGAAVHLAIKTPSWQHGAMVQISADLPAVLLPTVHSHEKPRNGVYSCVYVKEMKQFLYSNALKDCSLCLQQVSEKFEVRNTLLS